MKDTTVLPMGGQVWTDKYSGAEHWIISAGISGIRHKPIGGSADDVEEATEAEFKGSYKFARWLHR